MVFSVAKAQGPLIHCITNAVTAAFVADCVAAVGGRPMMAEDSADCSDLAKVADGLCINLGQLTEQKRAAILASLSNRGDRPWVLDPVGVDTLPSRLAFARQILAFKPTIIRGNAHEVQALAGGKAQGSGSDGDRQGQEKMRRRDWFELAKTLPAREVVATNIQLTPQCRDAAYTADGEFGASGGHGYMDRLPGFGCALSAVCAALGQSNATLETYNSAGRLAGTASLGDFRAAFLSQLSREQRRKSIRDLLRLYLVVGPQDLESQDSRALKDLVKAACANGITALQYRPKGLAPRAAYRRGLELLGLVQGLRPQLPVFGNDDWRLGARFGGNLHLGQTDGDVREARRLLGPEAIIGLSVSDPSHWGQYDPRAVDYVGIGPFAATQTKPDVRKPLGAAGIRKLRQGYEDVPAVAIGGIDAGNALEALGSGVDGIAVVSAIAKAPDPAAVTRTLAALVQSHFVPKGWTGDESGFQMD